MEVHTGHLGEANSNFSVCVCVYVRDYMCNSTYDSMVCMGRIGEL